MSRLPPHISILKEWSEYLTRYEFPIRKQDGSIAMKKGGEIRTRKLDLYDLAILDEIHSYEKRGGKKCFVSPAALAPIVGLYGREDEVIERIFQMACLGFIYIASIERVSKYGEPDLILAVDEEAVNRAIDSVKSSDDSFKIVPQFEKENFGIFDLRTDSKRALRRSLHKQVHEYLQKQVQEEAQEELTGIPVRLNQEVIFAEPSPEMAGTADID